MGAQCSSPQGKDLYEVEAQQHLDNHFDDNEVTKRLALMLKQTNEVVFKTPTRHSFVVNLGMVMLQCKTETRYKQPLASGTKFADIAVLQRAARYLKFAAAAYVAETKEDIFKVIHGEDEEDGIDLSGNLDVLHVYTSENAGECPSFFIAADKQTGDVVLSISGGTSVEDSISESAAQTTSLTSFLDGYANERLLAVSQKVIEQAKEPLENALNASEKPSLAIVGHSAGAGAATLAMLQGFGDDSVVNDLISKGKVKCYSFGSPPVFAAGEKPLPAKTVSAIYNFVNGMDCVPRTSVGSIGKLLMAVRAVDEFHFTTEERLKIMSGEVETQDYFPDYKEIPLDMEAELRCLPPTGTTVLLYKADGVKMVCEKLTKGQLDRILIHELMFKDHHLAAYEESIDECLMQLQRTKGCC